MLCINQNGILKNVQVTQRKAGKIKQKLKKNRKQQKKSHLNLSIKVNTLNRCNLNTPIKRNCHSRLKKKWPSFMLSMRNSLQI